MWLQAGKIYSFFLVVYLIIFNQILTNNDRKMHIIDVRRLKKKSTKRLMGACNKCFSFFVYCLTESDTDCSCFQTGTLSAASQIALLQQSCVMFQFFHTAKPAWFTVMWLGSWFLKLHQSSKKLVLTLLLYYKTTSGNCKCRESFKDVINI